MSRTDVSGIQSSNQGSIEEIHSEVSQEVWQMEVEISWEILGNSSIEDAELLKYNTRDPTE